MRVIFCNTITDLEFLSTAIWFSVNRVLNFCQTVLNLLIWITDNKLHYIHEWRNFFVVQSLTLSFCQLHFEFLSTVFWISVKPHWILLIRITVNELYCIHEWGPFFYNTIIDFQFLSTAFDFLSTAFLISVRCYF